MKTLFLQFADEGEANELLAPFVEVGMVIDVIGVISVATGETLDTPDGLAPEMAPLPGWFVNVLGMTLPDELQPFEIFPENPVRVFAVEPVRAPIEVSMAQCRLALFDQHGIETDEQFYALADVLPEADRPRAKLELRTRSTVRRDNPLVQLFGATKGWDLDELFIYAATL